MVKIGTQFFSSYADGMPKWEVTAKVGKTGLGAVWEAKILGPADFAGATKTFKTSEIEASLRINKLRLGIQSDNESFWGHVKLGDILHYKEGPGRYVRGQVVADENGCHTFLPTALLGEGNWHALDLPRRSKDGSIQQGTYAKWIKEKTTNRPHASNMWEFNPSKDPDPSQLKPVDLSLPEMTPEQKAVAAKYQLRNQLITALNNADIDQALAQAKELLK